MPEPTEAMPTIQIVFAAACHRSGLSRMPVRMATVGKSRAVVEIGRLHFGGFLAWIAWLALHITVLIGFRNRISVFISWIYSYFFFRRGSRLITHTGAHALEPARPPESPSRP